ncbi:MAG: LacI family DNA-binding transcriptional regulator [Armatimonadota bacterium]
MGTYRKTPTIRDVAEAAGVSISTVSNVIYQKQGYYSPSTAQRVWAAVEKLGYRPNHIARSLARRRTFTIGVVVEAPLGFVSHNAYFGLMLDGILHEAGSREYQVKIIKVPADSPEKAINYIEDGSVDGVVLSALFADNPLLKRMERSFVFAVVAGSIPPAIRLPCVDVDDISATYQAVHWLIELGHRRIGIITGDMNQWSAKRREQGYLMALREAGLEANPAWRVEGNYRMESGQVGIVQLLRADPRPTAVVCGNDKMAIGALHTLREMGVTVPHEISIIGFDDSEEAAFVSPPLTTIRQSPFDIGLHAAEMLLRQIEAGKRLQRNLILPAEMIIRQTVAPPLQR